MMWLPVLGAGICAALAFRHVSSLPIKYIATGRLILGQAAPASEEQREIAGGKPAFTFGELQIELVQSPELRKRALARLAAMNTVNPGSNAASMPEPPDVAAQVAKGTSILTVVATGSDSQTTWRYLDALLHEYVLFRREVQSQASNSSLNQLLDEIVRRDDAVKAALEKLREVEAGAGPELLAREVTRLAALVSTLREKVEATPPDAPPESRSAWEERLKAAELQHAEVAKKSQAIRDAAATVKSEEVLYDALKKKLVEIDAKILPPAVQVLERPEMAFKQPRPLLSAILNGSAVGAVLGVIAMLAFATLFAAVGKKNSPSPKTGEAMPG